MQMTDTIAPFAECLPAGEYRDTDVWRHWQHFCEGMQQRTRSKVWFKARMRELKRVRVAKHDDLVWYQVA